MSAVFFEPVAAWHDTESFRSGSTYLDWHLHHQALAHEQAELSRTFVLVSEENAGKENCPVEGYITLEAGAMPTAFLELTDADRALLPFLPAQTSGADTTDRAPGAYLLSQLPVVYLGFLARHQRNRRAGFGDILLVEALRRTELAAVHIGVAGLFLVATTEGVPLYERYGFHSFGDYDKKLFLSLRAIRQTLALLDNG